MPKKQKPNDQGKIIKAIKKHNYAFVWEEVKWVGSSDIDDISERRIVFDKAVEQFDAEHNNNFILFYKQRLHWASYEANVGSKLSTNRRVNEELKRQYISPTPDENEKTIANELRKWSY